MGEGRLSVIRDGIELPEEQARALWRAYSEHMDRQAHDVDGFARDHGFAVVKAEHRRGKAVLVVSSSASVPPPSRRSMPPSAEPRHSKGVQPRKR
ncbi:MAG: hypothetical protein NVS3B20_27420 [Polyangiales bacterium]